MKGSTKRTLFSSLLAAPSFLWVLAGFSIPYLAFFLWPVFFSGDVMQFPHYVPVLDPIGFDLKQMLSYSEALVSHQTPYIGANLYPPLASILFVPLLAVDYSLAFKILTLITLVCFFWMTYVFPSRLDADKSDSGLVILVFLTGLFSYGFQFEMERGQFNVIAAFLSLLAIWIFHRHHRYRILAYALFVVAVQLKVYPLIFIVMFVDDWRDWKNNLKRLFGLLAVNAVFLFVLGPSVFLDFLAAIKRQAETPYYIWAGNHSVRSFVALAVDAGVKGGLSWLAQYSGLIQWVLLAVVAACLFLVWLQAFRQNRKGINVPLLLACSIGALAIPSISHDYKLPLLAAPVALLLLEISSRLRSEVHWKPRLILMILVLVFSAAYSSTLFSFTNKPSIFDNNFPALLVMLLIVTGFSMLPTPSAGVREAGDQVQKSPTS